MPPAVSNIVASIIGVALRLWAKHVQRAVQEFSARYPSLSWGTYPGHDPTEDRATDGMVPLWWTSTGNALGWAVAKWIWANRVRLGVWYVIFDGKIISQTRPEKGWLRYYAADDPNPSKSHKNHVHASFYTTAPDPTPTPPATDPGRDDLDMSKLAKMTTSKAQPIGDVWRWLTLNDAGANSLASNDGKTVIAGPVNVSLWARVQLTGLQLGQVAQLRPCLAEYRKGQATKHHWHPAFPVDVLGVAGGVTSAYLPIFDSNIGAPAAGWSRRLRIEARTSAVGVQVKQVDLVGRYW